MASNNPFYVDPGNDFSAGLSGLSGTLSNIRQDRVQAAEIKRRDDAEAAQKERQQAATQAAQQAYQSGDPDMMAKASLQYPEIAQNLHQVVGLNDERKVKEAAGFARDLLLAPADQRGAIFESRIQKLIDEGRDPAHTVRAYQSYQQDPNRALQGIELDWAAGDPKGYSVIADKAKAEAIAARDARKESREDRKLDQQMTIAQMGAADRALTRQIAMLGAQQAQATNDLKRQEIQQKIDSRLQTKQETQQKLQNAAEKTASTFDQAIGTIDRLLVHPGLEKAVGRKSMFPTVPGGDAANFEAELDTLKAQTFLPQVEALKGSGALSDAEGKKLSDSIGALSIKMSQPELKKSLARVNGELSKARDRALRNVPKGALQQPAPVSSGASGGWEIIQ